MCGDTARNNMSSAAITINDLFYFQNYNNSDEYYTEKVGAESNYLKEGSVFNNDIDFVNSSIKEEKNEISIREKRYNRKYYLSQIDFIEAIGDDWSEEHTKGPNDFAIRFSRELVYQLIENELLPIRITQSIEEGMCFVFRNDQQFLYIEIYNDEEFGIVIEDYNKKKILKNKELIHQQEILEEIIEFNNYV
jgi:hypothetical protein